jgi:hypothetical protein
MSESNLDSAEQRKRLIFGIVGVIAGFGWAFYGGIGSLYGWVILFLLFWLGALGLFQAKEKT